MEAFPLLLIPIEEVYQACKHAGIWTDWILFEAMDFNSRF